jgi:hypothetical protein
MKNITDANAYNIIYWNCHMAQEKVRTALGLSIDEPYDPDKLMRHIQDGVMY